MMVFAEILRYISGTIHPYQVPVHLWEDRLIKLRAMGATVLQTYIAWNYIEPLEGQFDYSGQHSANKQIRKLETFQSHL